MALLLIDLWALGYIPNLCYLFITLDLQVGCSPTKNINNALFSYWVPFQKSLLGGGFPAVWLYVLR